MEWFQKDSKDVLKEQRTNTDTGLSNVIAKHRLEKFGLNQLEASKKINPLKLFFNQFKDVLVIILLIAAVVSWGLGLIDSSTSQSNNSLNCDTTSDASCVVSSNDKNENSNGSQEAILIFAIVIAIAVIGFANEYKAEKTVEELKKLVGSKATVRRDGKVIEIDSVEVVPGDIVLLEEGRKVPADIRLVSVINLQVNESSLTGESLPVNKQSDSIKGKVTLGDQKNMAFAGTFVSQGKAEGVVIETAQRTELGKIAKLVNEVESEETPMQRKLDDLGKKLGIMILVICGVVFVMVMLFSDQARDKDTIQRFVFAFTAAVALAVAAIPEGLAFVVRISLALGARRMADKNALVRKLSAVEALGSTDVVCSDKTGTLTKGEMTVREIVAGGQSLQVTGSGYSLSGEFQQSGKKSTLPEPIKQMLLIGVLCNNARLNNNTVLGDPTEGALLVSAGKAGIDYEEVQKDYNRINEVPFTSDRKFMSTVSKDKASSGYIVAAKGSLEATLARCSHIYNDKGKIVKLTPTDKTAIMTQNQRLASSALRVLAFAQKTTKTEPKNEKDIEKDLVFIGLQAMMDPPRTEVIEVIHRVQAEAGMRVIMITGDYVETAKAVAHEIGIEGESINGIDLDNMSQKEFEKRVEDISIYARVNPEHKIRIVKALKKRGHQVAMTGDGVNDAPAIKAADIGIAMGITGTDAAKEAADLILLDDQFTTIINAVEEGRGIFDNVRKFVNFLISCNIAEVLVILFGIVVFNNLLLTAVQLLFVNIVTDGLPAVALGSDPTRSGVLKSKPAKFQEAILTKRVWAEIFIFGSFMTLAILLQYWFNRTHESSSLAISAAFTSMVIYELVRLVDIRTDYKIKWFSNPLLTISMLISLGLQLAVLYLPAMAKYFDVGPLAASDWTFMIIGSVILVVIMKAFNPVLDRAFGSEISQAI